MNPILMFCYNNLDHTKKAVSSALEQDIETELILVNNGSTDATRQWISDLAVMVPNVTPIHFDTNISPIRIGNTLLRRIFSNSPHVLVIPNDAIIPSNCYSEMLKWPRGFVCATDNGTNPIPPLSPAKAISENTPMAVMMVRSWAYDAIVAKDGYFFDEGYFLYASDCDLALRMAACGLRGVQLDLPYYHVGSATHNMPEYHIRSCKQADRDREYFKQKWGFACDSLQYGQKPADLNFKAQYAKVTQSSFQEKL